MLARIFFGVNEVPIGIDENLVRCPSCEGYNLADIMVISKYFHFFWIPIFPMEKDLNVICKTCGLKRYGMNFDSNIISNYNEIKAKFKHPWFTYIGTTIFLLIFISIIFVLIFGQGNSTT